MKKYTIENNSYFIFNKELSQGMVHFLWGKFDFRIYLTPTDQTTATQQKKIALHDGKGTYFLANKLQYLRHQEWLDYEGVVEHGFTFEEVKWRKADAMFYTEFPKELLAVATQLTANELGLMPLT